MPKYMFNASLTGEGIAGVVKEGGTARRAVIRDSVERLGGTVEGFYFAFGRDDVIIICDLPDDETDRSGCGWLSAARWSAELARWGIGASVCFSALP